MSNNRTSKGSRLWLRIDKSQHQLQHKSSLGSAKIDLIICKVEKTEPQWLPTFRGPDKCLLSFHQWVRLWDERTWYFLQRPEQDISGSDEQYSQARSDQPQPEFLLAVAPTYSVLSDLTVLPALSENIPGYQTEFTIYTNRKHQTAGSDTQYFVLDKDLTNIQFSNILCLIDMIFNVIP